LAEIMQNIANKENKGAALSHKEDNAKLSAYFREILPEYDEDRVYPSDIKKILNWYNMLQERGMIVDEAPVVAEEAAPVAEEVVTEEVKAPVKKAKAKKE
jgi:hypothetical protein